LVIFESLETGKSSTTGQQLVGELGFVVRLVSLAVVVAGLVYGGLANTEASHRQGPQHTESEHLEGGVV
jgi:hypothetical protein